MTSWLERMAKAVVQLALLELRCGDIDRVTMFLIHTHLASSPQCSAQENDAHPSVGTQFYCVRFCNINMHFSLCISYWYQGFAKNMMPTKNLSATARAFKNFLLQHIDHLVVKYSNLT